MPAITQGQAGTWSTLGGSAKWCELTHEACVGGAGFEALDVCSEVAPLHLEQVGAVLVQGWGEVVTPVPVGVGEVDLHPVEGGLERGS